MSYDPTASSSSATPQIHVHRGPNYVIPVPMGPHQQPVTCPSCHRKVISSVQPRAGLLAWSLCMLLFFSGVATLGCCLVPFCLDDCNDVEHTCPACGCYLGKYARCGTN